MDEIYIKASDLPEWLVKKQFKGMDLISIEDLITTIEDLDSDLEHLKEDYEDFKKDVEENYKEKTFEQKYFSCE